MPIAESVRLRANVKIFHPDQVNFYRCVVGDETKIGSFVEIQKGATVGARCKVSSHSFGCESVTVEDEFFIGHGVMFTNDRFPRAAKADGSAQTEADWKAEPTLVRRSARFQSGLRLHSERALPWQGSGTAFERLSG